MVDIIAQALSQIKNAEKKGVSSCVVKPTSKTLRSILDLIKKEGYIGEFEVVDNGRGGLIKVNLLGTINDCGAIKPRFSTSLSNYQNFEKRYLPAKSYGLLIVSTTKGIMTQEEAKEKKLGGRLLAYIYWYLWKMK